MLKELYQAIRGDAKPVHLDIDGNNYVTSEIYPVAMPPAYNVEVSTLTGFIDYVNTQIKEEDKWKYLCHVFSPKRVLLLTCVEEFGSRRRFCEAVPEQISMKFNTYMDAEEFNIFLQSCFVGSDDLGISNDLGLVLKYASSVKQTIESGVVDDGVSQAVSLRTGIASTGTGILPNPVSLCPYRTFVEIPQPASLFVFRARSGPEFKLVEADGGKWRNEAMQFIKSYLQEALPGMSVVA